MKLNINIFNIEKLLNRRKFASSVINMNEIPMSSAHNIVGQHQDISARFIKRDALVVDTVDQIAHQISLDPPSGNNPLRDQDNDHYRAEWRLAEYLALHGLIFGNGEQPFGWYCPATGARQSAMDVANAIASDLSPGPDYGKLAELGSQRIERLSRAILIELC